MVTFFRDSHMEELKCFTHYQIIEKIAVGGMGAIYLAEQKGANDFTKTVAIKTIRASLISDPETLDLFIGEAKLVADLVHENIVQVYHFYEVDGIYYLIMEYAEGKNLENIMKRQQFLEKSVPLDVAVYMVQKICCGLDYSHRKRDRQGNRLKIVHRDISPSNIIITYGGGVKLTDFGIAKSLTMKTPDEHFVIMGKYPYMSPEQVQFEGTDVRSDIFSLGLVTYELLTGQMVFDVSDDLELLHALNKPIPPPSTLNSSIPKKLDAIVMKALEIKPEDRFASAKKMGEALEGFLRSKRINTNQERLAQYLELLFPEARKR